MATQTLEFNCTPGLTITAKLFAPGSDTIVDSVTATEKINHMGRYYADYTDVPAGNYELVGFIGVIGGFANEKYTLTADTATFYPLAETILWRYDMVPAHSRRIR